MKAAMKMGEDDNTKDKPDPEADALKSKKKPDPDAAEEGDSAEDMEKNLGAPVLIVPLNKVGWTDSSRDSSLSLRQINAKSDSGGDKGVKIIPFVLVDKESDDRIGKEQWNTREEAVAWLEKHPNERAKVKKLKKQS